MLLALALVCIALSVGLYLHAFSLRRRRVLQTIAGFRRYGFAAAETDEVSVGLLRQL